ncbi:MAG: c-type cytochrome [Phenylobacterium sp.]|uniref:c-type cytochrome n=1 Tax=Phenylobacterium sp. TaxID=1871053 RepID=UPI0025EC7DCC|nr:cytochrome c [Phenylobacterium sp.]MBI1200342.1 c-type cytochrome [Phenylobacterium sp.]
MTRTKIFARAGLAALAALLLVSAAGAEDDPRFKESARLYDTYCAQCHGVNRNGKGVNTVGLSVQPKDHTDTAGMSSIPREEMAGAIRNGGASVNKSALMPPWSSVFSDRQIDQMVDYLIHVCKCSKSE